MAGTPSAVSLVKAIELAATAVATAGRTIAAESAGPFGGLAVKTARLDFHFEVTVTRDAKGVTTGVGLRNTLFGPTVGRRGHPHRRACQRPKRKGRQMTCSA